MHPCTMEMAVPGAPARAGGHEMGGDKATTPETPPTEARSCLAAGIIARAGQIVFVFALQGLILLLGAGRLDWAWAWVLLGIYVASVAGNSVFLMRTNPETAAERGRPKETKGWDKVVSGLWGLAQYLALPLVAALDVRFGWTGGLALTWHVAGAVVLAAGLGLFGWARITNACFSTAVLTQDDRGQRVCRSGPYRAVRHAGYVGAILQTLGVPALLGSWWALVPGIAAVALIVVRTALEDGTLRAELPGYRELGREVRYRLMPGLW